MRVSLAGFHSVFPFERMAKTMGPVGTATGTQEHLQSFGEDRPYGPEGVHRISRTGSWWNILTEHTPPDVLRDYDKLSFPITNYKIVSAIRNEIASRLDVDSLQGSAGLPGNPILTAFTSV